MFASNEHPSVSLPLSSMEMDTIEDMTIPHRVTETLTINPTTRHNSISLRFKVSVNHSSSVFHQSFFFSKKKRKRKLESDTVSLRSFEEFVGEHFQRKKRLSLPRLSSVSELFTPMRDRVINILQTTKQSSTANLLNLLGNNTNNSRRKAGTFAHGSSSPNTVKRFRAAWSETCDGEKLKQTMTATEIERQNVIYELLSEEQQMIENLGLAQRVSEEGNNRKVGRIFSSW